MDPIESNIQAQDPAFQENRSHMESLADELAKNLNSVRERDGTDAAALHRSRGKMLVRERIQTLLDPGAPFLEFSPLAAWKMYEDENPAGGIVTGIGNIHGKQVVIVANDATVKGGTYYPITVKNTFGPKRSPWKTAFLASTWWIPVGRSCRFRPMFFLTGTTLAAFSTTSPRCRRKVSPKWQWSWALVLLAALTSRP